MADSNITKNALSRALKEFLKTQPLDKISVGSICEKCGMNRKSFYYHFQDKYDLINWIYDTEFIEIIKQKEYASNIDLVQDICEYFYNNRSFYQKTLRMEGQNSFSDYFRDILILFLTEDLADAFTGEPSVKPFAEFYADALLCAIKKWLMKKDCEPPREFVGFLKKCLFTAGRRALEYYHDPGTEPGGN